MTDIHQVQQDLQYVREVVDRADQSPRRPIAIYLVWAIYVLIGYPLVDFAPHLAHFYFFPAFITAMVLTAWLSHRMKKAAGVKPRQDRSTLFWFGGAILIVLCLIGLSAVLPLHDQAQGQLAVVIVGIFYFLGGVIFDRNFMVFGPVLCAAGLAVKFVPHYGWTALGIVFAMGLLLPALFSPRPPAASQTM